MDVISGFYGVGGEKDLSEDLKVYFFKIKLHQSNVFSAYVPKMCIHFNELHLIHIYFIVERCNTSAVRGKNCVCHPSTRIGDTLVDTTYYIHSLVDIMVNTLSP